MFAGLAWAMGQPAGGSDAAQGFVSFIPLIIIFVIFYFLLIRPQQQKQKKHKEMLKGLKVGDRIVTLGGIYGRITEVEKETFIIEIADKVKIKIRQAAVSYLQDSVVDEE